MQLEQFAPNVCVDFPSLAITNVTQPMIGRTKCRENTKIPSPINFGRLTRVSKREFQCTFILNRPLRGNVNFFREQTEDCAASLLTCVYVRCSSTQMRTFTDETER